MRTKRQEGDAVSTASPFSAVAGKYLSPSGSSSLGRGGSLMAGNAATRGGKPRATLASPPIALGEGKINRGREVGGFVCGDQGGESPN